MRENEGQYVATLIGDLVGSRSTTDRRRLHEHLAQALGQVNQTLRPLTPLRITVADEYQGVFAGLGDAIAATLLLRVALLPEIDARHGLGLGAVTVLAEEPRVEDGPGWWAARAAIERVQEQEERTALRGVRTAYVAADQIAATGESTCDPGIVNAALMWRDQLLSGLSARSLSVLRGLLAGSTQSEIAEHEGISPSAVSQRVRHDGLGVVLAGHEQLSGERISGRRIDGKQIRGEEIREVR